MALASLLSSSSVGVSGAGVSGVTVPKGSYELLELESDEERVVDPDDGVCGAGVVYFPYDVSVVDVKDEGPSKEIGTGEVASLRPDEIEDVRAALVFSGASVVCGAEFPSSSPSGMSVKEEPERTAAVGSAAPGVRLVDSSVGAGVVSSSPFVVSEVLSEEVDTGTRLLAGLLVESLCVASGAGVGDGVDKNPE